MSVPSLEKIPMVLSLPVSTSGCVGGRRVTKRARLGVVLGDGHRHVIDDRLELVEVQVLELQGVDDDHRVPLEAEGAVDHLGGVQRRAASGRAPRGPCAAGP